MTSRTDAVLVIAGHELRAALRGRMIPAFAALFAALAIIIALAGLAGSGRLLVQGFTRTSVSLRKRSEMAERMTRSASDSSWSICWQIPRIAGASDMEASSPTAACTRSAQRSSSSASCVAGGVTPCMS